MDIQLYNRESFKETNLKYPLDQTVDILSDKFYSEQGMDLTFSKLLSSTRDVKINNFSTLFLSGKKRLSDFFKVNPLTKDQVSFTTFLAFDAVGGLRSDSILWAFNEGATIGDNAAALDVETITTSPKNRHFFKVTLLNDFLCTISHNDENIERYLTLDYTFNLNFALKYDLYFGQVDSPQVFYYFYDRDDDLFVLYKKILDFPYYVTFSTVTNKLLLKQPPLGPNFPFPYDAILKCRPHSTPADEYQYNEFVAIYAKNNKLNSLNTDGDLSRTNVTNNYLIHSEYSTITSKDVNINILTLKNELNSNNSNNHVDVFLDSDRYTSRDYTKIFSGTQQTLGNDSIVIGYDGFTSSVNFKADKLTYFHIPYETYPFKRLNVNDTSLVDSGAIASDHPIKADRIFKKRANYKDYLYFGNASDENNGEYLCTWLSGVDLPNTRPLWVDRYYNPSAISFISALTSIPSSSAYNTNFSTVVSEASTNAVVFDKPSDLYFEPGVYYAYYRMGAESINNYLNILDNTAVQRGLINNYVDNTQLYGTVDEVSEFIFNGQQYSKTIGLTDISQKNEFTLAFDLKTDFNTSFTNQLIGNFVNEGFGIFNNSYITPVIHYFSGNTLNIYNTLGTLIDSIVFDADIRGVIRLQNLKDFYVILEDSRIMRLAIDGKINFAVETNIVDFEQVNSVFYNSTSAQFITNTVSAKNILNFCFDTNEIVDATSDTNLHNNIAVSAANSVVSLNGEVYATSARNVKLQEDSLFYLDTETTLLRWELTASNTANYPFFTTTTPIRDFSIDRDGNFWLLFDSKVVKYNSTRQFIMSANIADSSFDPINIDFVNELRADGFKYYAHITSKAVPLSANGLKINQIDGDGISVGEYYEPLERGLYYNMNVANSDYCRREIIGDLVDNSLNIKAGLRDSITNEKTELNLHYSLTNTDATYQNIVVRYDGNQGQLALFINGKKVEYVNFDPGDLSFETSFKSPMVLGASPFLNNLTLPTFLRQRLFYTVNSQIKNFRIFDYPLKDSDILLISNRDKTIRDIKFDVSTGKRCYLDEIERIFKMDVPQVKSNTLKIKIKNTGITDPNLQAALKTQILNRVNTLLPYNGQIQDIEWIN